MDGQAWAILKADAEPPDLVSEVDQLLKDCPPPPAVNCHNLKRLSSNDPQCLFEYVGALVEKVYRAGRRAKLGGRGMLSLRVGIAFDSDPSEAFQRAVTLASRASIDTVLAAKELTEALNPLGALPFDRTAPVTVEGRVAFETYPPDHRDCFVVMPMGDPESALRERSELVLDRLIRPACQQLRLRPIAPTRQAGDTVSRDVFGALHLSNLVVAYLGRRPWGPNVMIEVGYRLALGRPLVLIADEEPPFDLHDHRAVILPPGPDAVGARVSNLVDEMRDRLANGFEGGDLYPTADIQVDERPVPDQTKLHKIVAASEATAQLFGLPRDVLIGMTPADLIAHLGDLMGDPVQFEAFQEEQAELYRELSALGGPTPGVQKSEVTAMVPLTFFNHAHPRFNGRAFIPYVINHSRRPGVASRQRVVYLEVTRSVSWCRVKHRQIRVCDLKKTNSNLAFELYARSFDTILNRLSNYTAVRDTHISAIAAKCGQLDGAARILDVGAGTGNVTAPLVESGMQVWAIDQSRAMLQRLSEKINGRANCVVDLRDCQNLRPFESEFFDGVTMSLVLFAVGSVEGAREALCEAIRVLKPGGVIVVTEPKKDFQLAPLLRQAEQELRSQPDWLELKPHWDQVFQANSMIDPQKSEFLPAEEIRDQLRAAAFTLGIREAYGGNCWTITAAKPERTP